MVAENITSVDIAINILVQLFNIVLFLIIFKYFFADSIISAVDKRRQLLSKLKKAEQEYEEIIKNAEEKKQEILNQALEHKQKLIEEAKALAYTEREKIIKEASKQADEIVESAKAYWEKLKKELIENWERSLKETSKAVVLKLFENNIDLQEKYLDEVVKQFKS